METVKLETANGTAVICTEDFGDMKLILEAFIRHELKRQYEAGGMDTDDYAQLCAEVDKVFSSKNISPRSIRILTNETLDWEGFINL